jgi:hypothetical protein
MPKITRSVTRKTIVRVREITRSIVLLIKQMEADRLDAEYIEALREEANHMNAIENAYIQTL